MLFHSFRVCLLLGCFSFHRSFGVSLYSTKSLILFLLLPSSSRLDLSKHNISLHSYQYLSKTSFAAFCYYCSIPSPSPLIIIIIIPSLPASGALSLLLFHTLALFRQVLNFNKRKLNLSVFDEEKEVFFFLFFNKGIFSFEYLTSSLYKIVCLLFPILLRLLQILNHIFGNYCTSIPRVWKFSNLSYTVRSFFYFSNWRSYQPR